MRIKLILRAAMYWISGWLFIKEIRGGASLRQIDLVLSESSASVMNLSTTLAAERTKAGLECAKFGIIRDTFSSLKPYGILSAR